MFSSPFRFTLLSAVILMLSCSAEKTQTCFQFTRAGSLIDCPENMPSPGPYYTCLVSMADVDSFPFDYALYFSTDHHHGDGGIYLWLCDGDPADRSSWLSYDQAVFDGFFDYLEDKPVQNPVFMDTTQGRQTETPHVNVIEGQVYMTYHNYGAGREQSTLLALSDDGVNFSRIHGENDSIVLDYGPDDGPGDGHTGYFRWGANPFAGVHYAYVGYSLHGGTDNFYSAMWGSQDAVSWEKLQVFTPMEGYAMPEENMIVAWHEMDPNSIRKIGENEYAAMTAGGNRASGSVERVVELYEIYLAGDGKTLTRPCRKILAQGPAGSDDSEEVSQPSALVVGDTWHLIYVGVKNKGKSNTVMGAVGRFDPENLRGHQLPEAEKQRHFWHE